MCADDKNDTSNCEGAIKSPFFKSDEKSNKVKAFYNGFFGHKFFKEDYNESIKEKAFYVGFLSIIINPEMGRI